MQKFETAVLLLCGLLLFGAGTALAAPATQVSCIANEPDAEGYFDVSVEIQQGRNLAMIQFALKYDPEIIKCVSAESGALLTDNQEPTVNTDIAGVIYFVWDSLEPLEQDGQLLLLHMKLLDSSSGEIGFNFEEDFIFALDDFTELDVLGYGCAVGEEAETSEDTVAEIPQQDTQNGAPQKASILVVVLLVMCIACAAVFFAGKIRKKPKGKHSCSKKRNTQ